MKTQGLKWSGLSVVLLAGFVMAAPSAFAASAGGYSATCKDGTSWSGASKRGACRGHKGVQNWTSEGAASSAASESGDKASHERKSRRSNKSEATTGAAATRESAATETAHSAKPRGETASMPASGAVNATCKDGTTWSGKSKRGACRGHKGVADWGDTGTAIAPSAAPPPATPVAPAPPAATHEPVAPQRPTSHTASGGGSMGAPAPGGGAGKVWVNSTSKTYHCQGTRWYGTTKHGEYMSEAQAKAQGYHADHGKACSS